MTTIPENGWDGWLGISNRRLRTAWLIERAWIDSPGDGPFWWFEYPDGFHSWTKTAAEAKRFVSKEAAEAHWGAASGLTATEHVFGLLPRRVDRD